ncbi:MAG: glycoside hydrolase family 13 [Planctomycetia bacterium]|nr:glycoside hydrolase family 13 [Planctomycetia bacterium]
MAKRSKGTKATVFQCHAPAAHAVFLAGTFNEWSAGATPMAKDAEGDWSVALDLKPGRYEFKFVVDGAWCCEPGCQRWDACTLCVPNPFGTMNLVIEVA